MRVHLVGKIEVAGLIEFFPARRRADFAQHVGHVLAGERFLTDGHDLAVPADLGRLAFAQVKIGSPLLNEGLKKLVDVSHGRLSPQDLTHEGFVFRAIVGFLG